MPGSKIQLKDIGFLIIGAAKSATTWLQTQLQADPAVYMPDPELHFFSREYARGVDWYLEQFQPAQPGLLIGEKSNTYLADPAYAARIYSKLPQARLIAQLRNPVERAYSDYCMLFRRGEVDADIEAHLDPRRAAGGRFLSGGDYASQLQPFVERFGRERLLILFFDDIEKKPDASVAAARRHLELPEAPVKITAALKEKVKDRRSKTLPVGLRRALAPVKPWVQPLRGAPAFEAARSLLAREPNYPSIPNELRARLADHYAPGNERLAKLLGRPIDWR